MCKFSNLRFGAGRESSARLLPAHPYSDYRASSRCEYERFFGKPLAEDLHPSLLRDLHRHEIEFVTITWFISEQAVRAFAGPDNARAVVSVAARALLSRFDERSAHYTMVLAPDESREDHSGAPAR